MVAWLLNLGKGGYGMKTKQFICFFLCILLFSISLPAVAYGKNFNGVSIVRDEYGVPHIFAGTRRGLAFGAGYAVAQDRLWQADLYRRQASGRLAEFGLATIEQDYEIRKSGYSQAELKEMFDSWTPSVPTARLKEMSHAFVAGINKYIRDAKKALLKGDLSLIPVEYLPGVIQEKGLPLRPFTIEDTTAIVVMMAWRFGGTGGNELRYAAALQALQDMHGEEVGWQIFNDLFPQIDPGAEVTIPAKRHQQSTPKTATGRIPTIPENIGEVFKKIDTNRRNLKELFESIGLPTKFGSNAWVVNRWKSTTRNPLQVGGPQMGHSIPQIVLEIGLHGAGIDAIGMMMPHAPSILIGVSQHGAWTSTTGGSDVIDTYMEVLKPDNHTQYLYNGEFIDMEVRTETICDYAGNCEDREIYRTIHGPVLEVDESNHLAFSIKLPYYKNELAAEEGWSLFQQARNLNQFEQSVKTIQPSHNFFWIGRKGEIGYWHAGTFPIKPTHGKDGNPIDDRLPLWGTGEEEWVGLTGFEDMPRSINPLQGFLANWNNKPISDWPYAEADWGEGHRVKRIQELLASGGKFSFEDMNGINMDAGYNHIPAMNFLGYLIEAAQKSPEIPVDVVKLLKAWDHHYNDIESPIWPDPNATYDDPGLTIFNRWFQKIGNEVFDDDLPQGVRASDSTLIHVFDGLDSKLPLSYDFLNGEDRDAVIVRTLKEALEELETEFGSVKETWLTPVLTVTFSQLGALSPPTMHAMNRGTYNHIAEMPIDILRQDPPQAMNVIPPGQSGFYNAVVGPSPHAYDQLELYESWTYKPVFFDNEAILKGAESRVDLIYP